MLALSAATVEAVQRGLELPLEDPLAYWHHSSRQSRDATRLLAEVDELYARGPNKGGKTEWAVAAALAMLQKRPTLDGIPIPQWRGKVDGLVLVRDYQQQKLSVQQTVLRLLGRWPCHAKWKADDVLSSLRIKPVHGGADESTWSTLTFMSQENRRSGLGARGDIVLGDECPVEEIWRELRKAAHAGRRMVRLIPATPLIRRQYQWLKDDYGESCPRGGIARPTPDWAEVRWSVHDNSALSPAEIAKLLREYARDPLRDARVHGDYVDATASCPFDAEVLERLLAHCQEPDLHEWTVTRQLDSQSGRAKVVEKVEVEVFELPERGEVYYIAADPSAGINDRLHDPGGLHVWARRRPRLVARYNGYIGSYGLGVLAVGLARQYHEALVDPETTGGWGEGFLDACSDCGYGNLNRQRVMDRRGEPRTVLGFQTTEHTRPGMIDAIQRWLVAARAGELLARIPSRPVLECLLDVILDDRNRPVAAPGFHDEDMILTGQSLRTVLGRARQPAPAVHQREPGALTDEDIERLLVGGRRKSPTPRAAAPRPRLRQGGTLRMRSRAGRR